MSEGVRREHVERSIDLRPQDRRIVAEILDRYLPAGYRVHVFGSRANGRARRGSDLDLAVEGSEPLSWRARGVLADAFEESMLPMRVDVVDLRAVDESFAAVVRRTSLPWPDELPT